MKLLLNALFFQRYIPEVNRKLFLEKVPTNIAQSIKLNDSISLRIHGTYVHIIN